MGIRWRHRATVAADEFRRTRISLATRSLATADTSCEVTFETRPFAPCRRLSPLVSNAILISSCHRLRCPALSHGRPRLMLIGGPRPDVSHHARVRRRSRRRTVSASTAAHGSQPAPGCRLCHRGLFGRVLAAVSGHSADALHCGRLVDAAGDPDLPADRPRHRGRLCRPAQVRLARDA